MVIVLLLVGAACFLLAALGVAIPHIALVPLGLLAWIVADIVGTVPGWWDRRRPGP
jgi:hypothetical protein